MRSKSLGNSRWLQVLVIATILFGCCIRFYDLGAKVYWEDETFTSLRVAGYTRQELIDANFQGRVIYPEALQNFQVINENKGALDTVASLADDVHPPGYFFLLRLWAQGFGSGFDSGFGSSATAMRSLSALISLLLLPSVYWLCITLFERWPTRHDIGLLSIALVSVSPFHLIAATEARMYSLWAVLTTLSGVFLLRALRHHRRSDWILYTLTGIGSLYVHWFTVLVLFSQGLYLLLVQGVKWTRLHKAYLFSLSAIGIAILPWVIFVGRRLTYVYSQTTWTAVDVSLLGESSLTHRWLSTATQLFFVPSALPQMVSFQWPLAFLATAVIAGSIAFVAFRIQKSARLFLLISSGLIFCLLAASDLALGGQRSTIFRYLIPAAITIEISVALTLIHSNQIASQAIGCWLMIVLLVGGVFSQAADKASFTSVNQPLVRVAEVLNTTPNSRLVSDTRPSQLLPLANLLRSDQELQFTVRPQRPDLTDTADRTIFLYETSEGLQADLEKQGYLINPVLGIDNMFQLEMPSPP